MSGNQFDRSEFYRQLEQLENRLAAAIGHRLAAQARDDLPSSVAYGLHCFRNAHYGERAANVRRALDESEAIALRGLEAKLGNIELGSIWHLLRSVCHDIALYLGGGALAGAALGGGLGAFAFGAGAVPGAIAGTAIGVKIGGILLSMLGLKSIVEQMLENIPAIAHAYQDGVMSAWGRMPDTSANSFDAPHYGSDFQLPSTYHAARAFGRGHELLIIALLTGIVSYLTRGKGQFPALLAEMRASARLGPKFADWVQHNADKLTRHPLLQVRREPQAVSRGTNANQGAITSNNTETISKGNANKLVKNKFPEEVLDPKGKILGIAVPQDGRITISGQNNLPQKTDFVVTEDGKLIIGYKHTTLANNKDVLIAGQMKLSGRGNIRAIDNLSGHYRPTVEEGLRVPQILNELGFSTKNTYLKLYEFSTDSEGNVINFKTIVNRQIK